MSEVEQTKVCPFCAETVKAAAKICPFCRSKLVRYALLRQECGLAVSGLALMVLAIAVIAWLAPNERGVGGRSFAGYRNDLVVLNTSLERDAAEPDFWLTGIVTNRSDHPWRVQSLEVRFLDERGTLLDVRHSNVKDLFVVQSHQEHAFRAQLGELVFTNGNVTHQVCVQIATDGDRPLKQD